MFTGIDIASTVPFAIATGFAIVVLFLEVLQRPSFGRGYLAYITAFGLALTGVSALALRHVDGQSTFGGMAYLDGYAQVFTVLFCFAGAASALVAPNFLSAQKLDRGEYYALLLFAVAGMIMMVGAGDFVTFFVALETQGVAVYALASFLRHSPKSAEAGLKYFVIGALASAIMLMGIALIYGVTGTTQFAAIGDILAGSGGSLGLAGEHAILAGAGGHAGQVNATLTNFDNIQPFIPIAALGMVLIVVAFMVKVAAVPFHMWAPDVYTGSPTPIVGFMAAAVKIAGFAALIRLLALAFHAEAFRMGEYGWVQILFVVSLLSMAIGNFVAIVQKNVKRMLAYSSVAHAGYLLIALVAMGYADGNVDLTRGVVFYGFAYTFGTVGAFGALAYLGRRGQEAETFDDLNGLGYRYPWLGLVLSIFMLSSAGIPPTAGFMGKLMLFESAIEASKYGAAHGMAGSGMLITLAVVGILTSVAGVFYYLKVMVHLYMKKPIRAVYELPHSGAKFAIAICAALTIWFGIFPQQLVRVADEAVAQMMDRADSVYLAPDADAE